MAPIERGEITVTLDNISDGETLHQRAVLLIGQCSSTNDDDFLAVRTADAADVTTFPTQHWPISGGHFKALVILSPGTNVVSLEHNGDAASSTSLNLTYIPLLQTPPLHLAIMIAKDSPLLIDCPPFKRGAISSAHSDLEAAIKKFRMTAYMWQALTAEDMRATGLGRRSFRLEEEWMTETLSREFIQASLESSANHMRSTAKIHLVRSEKTIAELRDAQVAQQNPNARRKDDLFKYFDAALKAYGGPFASSAHPVVAGLILDSTFSTERKLILGHAALGCSNINDISLGMFGSHLTYSWPRFLEEVSATLLDISPPGDTVGNDNRECETAWEACSVGQGAFLHEVGHAFGAPHTTGIMARGYSQDWPKNFLSRTSYCAQTKMDGLKVVNSDTENDARWDLRDKLLFKTLRHFWLPMDELRSDQFMAAEPSVKIICEEQSEEFSRLVISCPAGIARVELNDMAEAEPTIAAPSSQVQFTMDELEARFERNKPLSLNVIGMNGKSRNVTNAWKLFSRLSFIRIPGSSIILQKQSIMCNSLQKAEGEDETRDYWDWAVLLTEKGKDGKLSRATTIDSRVGALLDGAVVYYEDGHKTHCGPRWNTSGQDHRFGGHASQKIAIPEGVAILKVQVSGDHELNGLRFHLSNDTQGGHLYNPELARVLEPATDQKIIGFYGRSNWGLGFFGVKEFGIITAPKQAELPLVIYDMPELQNTDGGTGVVCSSQPPPLPTHTLGLAFVKPPGFADRRLLPYANKGLPDHGLAHLTNYL